MTSIEHVQPDSSHVIAATLRRPAVAQADSRTDLEIAMLLARADPRSNRIATAAGLATIAVLRDILLLLTEANTTPAQRGALITVLNEYDGVKPLESVKDHRGRAGRGVDVPAGGQLVRVIFAPETSEPRVAGRDRVAGAPLG